MYVWHWRRVHGAASDRDEPKRCVACGKYRSFLRHCCCRQVMSKEVSKESVVGVWRACWLLGRHNAFVRLARCRARQIGRRGVLLMVQKSA